MTDWANELRGRLEEIFAGAVEVDPPRLLPGGASKEAWAVDVRSAVGELPLLVRRAGGGVIHADTLPLEHEHRVIEVAYGHGVAVPRPFGYLGELGGREAFASARVQGETIHQPTPTTTLVQTWTYLQRTPHGITFGYLNGMRPRGVLLFEGKLRGDTLSGDMRFAGVNARGM